MGFDLDRCVGYVTDNAMKHIAEAFGNRLKDSKLTRIQWIALYHIDRKSPISQRDFSRLMNVQDSSGGRLIDRLERDGLVMRIKDPMDRRIILIELSESGKALYNKALSVGAKFNEDLIKDIDQKDLETFERVLNQLTKNVAE